MANTIFYDNTANAPAGDNLFNQAGNFCTLCDSFSTPAGGKWIINTLKLGLRRPSGAGSGNINVDIYTDNGPEPGGSVGTLVAHLAVGATITFTSNVAAIFTISITPQSLNSGTRYWIVCSMPVDAGVAWETCTIHVGDIGVSTEFNAGLPVASGFCFYNPTSNNTFLPFQMQVSGTPAGINDNRFGVKTFLSPQPANSIPYRLCVNNNRLHCLLPGNDNLFSDFVYYLGRENNQGGYWYRYVVDPAALFSEEDGKLYAGFGDAGQGNLFVLDAANTSNFAGSTINIDCLFPFSKNEINQRKDVYHLRFHVDTGNSTLNLTGYTEFPIAGFSLGTIQVNGLQEINILIQNTNFNLAKRMALRICGAAAYFKLIDWSIDYELRPEPLSFLRIATNYNLAAKKRLRTVPIVIDTRGQAVNINVIADGVSLGNQSFTTNERTTVFYYMSTDVFATDIIINITATSGNIFEFYDAPAPVNVEVLPVGKLFDQIGPIELERIGALLEFRVRMLATTNTITYNVYMDDVEVVTAQPLTVTPNVDKTYGPIKMPKGIQGSVCRVEFLSSNGVFYRWNCKLKFTTGGTKSDTKQVTIQDKSVGLQS